VSATDIVEVTAWEAFDSRGRPTVACRVRLAGGGTGRVVVPSGASVGSYEARELRDGGERYAGAGVLAAAGNVEQVLGPAVRGMDAADRPAVDMALESADPDPAFGGVGANAVLAVSLAVTLAYADALREPLWRVLSGGGEPLLPLPMVNIISGGAHARGALDIQDVLVVPVGAGDFAQAIEWAWRVRRAAAELLDARGGSSALVADEGGLAASLPGNQSALALVTDAIVAAGLRPGDDAGLAVDVAADQIFAGDRYRLRTEGRVLTAAEWVGELRDWCARYPLLSLEDVLTDDDWSGWQLATEVLADHRQLLGDDLFATNLQRLQRGVEAGVANAVLVKPNQAGTVTRAETVMRQAQLAGYATVVSARSGDTEDSWLADLSIGWRSGQIKVGSTTRSERTSKWNRLLEVQRDARGASGFAGRKALARTHPHAVPAGPDPSRCAP
jgi:enolase